MSGSSEDVKERFVRAALEELEPYRQPWGGYRCRLQVNRVGDKVLAARSPDLRGFNIEFHNTNLARVTGVTEGIRNSLKWNFKLKNVGIYYAHNHRSFVIDGDDQSKGLLAGDSYHILIVPEDVEWKAPSVLPKETAPEGVCPILKPAF